MSSNSLLDILNDGFNDLTLGNTSCYLNTAIYELIIDLNPMMYSASTVFFTGDTRTKVPLDSEYADVLKSIISNVPGVESVEYDLFTNKVKIIAEPNNQQILSQVLTIRLKITYDIICTS
jgi:copper chaperone CopZ